MVNHNFGSCRPQRDYTETDGNSSRDNRRVSHILPTPPCHETPGGQTDRYPCLASGDQSYCGFVNTLENRTPEETPPFSGSASIRWLSKDSLSTSPPIRGVVVSVAKNSAWSPPDTHPMPARQCCHREPLWPSWPHFCCSRWHAKN